MQQDYEHTEQIQDLMEALARAQANMKNPVTDKANPHFKSRYPSLAIIRDAVMPPLNAEGIALTQLPLTSETQGGCVTILWLKDQYLKSTLRLPVAKGDPQAYGSAIAYARRYALLAICNIAGEEDDDGNQAAGKEAPSSQQGGTHERQNTSRRSAAEAAARQAEEERAQQAEAQRQALLSEIWILYKEAIQPLKHAGLHKAIFHHCFRLDKPEQIKEQALEDLDAGMALYRHLTAQVVTWDRSVSPHAWIGEQQRLLATQAEDEASVPEGVDRETGEDHRDMPTGWLTEEERREQQERAEAALLAQAEHD